MTQAERIAMLETRMKSLEEGQKETNEKLDLLMALKHKGAGAFWLATSLFGVSLMGVVTMLTSWWKG